jgi:hypothetical protein
MPFWVASVPVFFFFLLRMPFPDIGFDNINYHIINGDMSLDGFPFANAPLFFMHVGNTLPDMVMAAWRWVFGYRLGTIPCLLAMLWTLLILERLVRRHVRNVWLGTMALLAVSASDSVLHLLDGYMVDLFPVPFGFLAIEIIVYGRPLFRSANSALAAFALGTVSLVIAGTLKPTAVIFIVPCVGMLVFRLWSARLELGRAKWEMVKTTSCVFGFVAFAVLPHHAYMYWLTGNPVFPLYNNFFQSPFAQFTSFRDIRWGPMSLDEVFVWPVKAIRGERVGELPSFLLRTALGYALGWVTLALMLMRRRSSVLGLLAIIMVVGSFLWSYTTGYLRYGAFLEPLGGLLVLAVVAQFLDGWRCFGRGLRLSRAVTFSIIGCLVTAAVVLVVVSIDCAYRSSWSGRPTLFEMPSEWMSEWREIGRDRKLKRYLDEGTEAALDDVDCWVSCGPVSSGFMSLLKPRIPYMDFFHLAYRGPEKEKLRQRALERLGGMKSYTLISYQANLGQTLENSLEILEKGGLCHGQAREIRIPFFSDLPRFSLAVHLVPVQLPLK